MINITAAEAFERTKEQNDSLVDWGETEVSILTAIEAGKYQATYSLISRHETPIMRNRAYNLLAEELEKKGFEITRKTSYDDAGILEDDYVLIDWSKAAATQKSKVSSKTQDANFQDRVKLAIENIEANIRTARANKKYLVQYGFSDPKEYAAVFEYFAKKYLVKYGGKIADFDYLNIDLAAY